jgi:hypothetical protein
MSNNLWSRFSGVLIILAGSLTLTSCASVQNVTSSPTNEAVVVDGMRNDWMGRLTQIEDDNIAFGFKNDDKSLYILDGDSQPTKHNENIKYRSHTLDQFRRW